VTYQYVVVSIDDAGKSKHSSLTTVCPRTSAPMDVIALYNEHIDGPITLKMEICCETERLYSTTGNSLTTYRIFYYQGFG
jgi:hypothetical protein